MPQRKRAHKVSKGEHGAKKWPLSDLARVLMGKGQYRTLKPISTKAPWRGVAGAHVPFDAAQARLNREMYPWLFEDN